MGEVVVKKKRKDELMGSNYSKNDDQSGDLNIELDAECKNSAEKIRSNNNDEEEGGNENRMEGKSRKRKRKRKKKNQIEEKNTGDDIASINKSGSAAILDIILDKEKKGEKSADMVNAVRERLASKTTVYVEGIPFNSSEDAVRCFFEQNGCKDVIELRLPKWQDTGRLRGYGHVVFKTEGSRHRALTEVSGKNMGSRYIVVKEPNEPISVTISKTRDQPSGCRVVFIKNLPYDVTENDVQETFRVCGKILEGGVRLALNSQTKQPKGFGYVDFKNPEGAATAVSKASKPFGITMKGRPIFVDYEENTMKGSFRTTGGKLWSKEHGSSDNKKR